MKRLNLLFAALLSALAVIAAGPVEGSWEGHLEARPGTSLRIVINFTEQGRKFTLDSPDQGALGIEGRVLYNDNDSIRVAIPKIAFAYAGRLKNGVLSGQFAQGALLKQLDLKRIAAVERRRPQTPQPPFPYTTEDVYFDNPQGPARLAGTLTIPEGADTKTPVLLMVSGSGLQNRDEEIFLHKPFAVIADFLARNGVATLRYDDRGTGASTGNPMKATTADFAEDAAAGLEWLRRSGRFGKVGLLGHSEGGMIAFMTKPDFIIAIGAPSVRGDSVLIDQNIFSMCASGFSEPMARMIAAKAVPDMLKTTDNAWMRYFGAYSPAADIAACSVPALVIYGELDMQVRPALNLEPMKTLLPSGDIRVYPLLNHLMQHAATGSPDEYGDIEETFAPEVLADILNFITNLK